ncbi:MAG TPA: NHL repeat-containing protein [Solirubrobacteraceae bacterium]|nr:NHL repeat-containing protein [Solirubrobacteraceae bacterium]
MIVRQEYWFVRPFTGVAATFVGVLACLLIAVSAAPALASWGNHKSVGGGHLEFPTGVAVDESGGASTGDVYVGNFFGDFVTKFDASGAFLSPPSPIRSGGVQFYSGVAVNPTNKRVYAVNAEANKIEVFEPSGTVGGTPISVPGSGNFFGFTVVEIAADAKGNVYVPNAPNNDVEVFNEKGEAQPTITGDEGAGKEEHTLKSPEGVAIDPSGNVWVADTGDGRIEEFEPNGTFMKAIPSAGVRAVALDGSGDVFASIGGAKPYVIEYSPSGAVIDDEIGKGLLSESSEGTPNGIAVDRAREILYVVNGGGNVIERFTNWAVSTEPPSSVEEGKATLHGMIEVEPGSSIASCGFEYGPTTAYGSTVRCLPEGPYTTNTPVSAMLSGLSGATHYRIAATTTKGYAEFGDDLAFGPPEVDGQSAEATVTTATLRANVTVIEAGASTCKEAQYVAEQEYAASGFTHAQSVPCTTPIGSTPGEYEVETAEIKGLRPNTVYHYRFLTTNQNGTGTGPGGEFATFGIAPDSFAFEALGQAGEPITQAGAHPYKWTDTLRLNTSTHKFTNGTTDPLAPDANVKDIVTELPPGLIGNPNATPKCQAYEVVHRECSGAAQVGILIVYTANPGHVASHGEPEEHEIVPIYNLVPPKGLAAQFGANIAKVADVRIDARVRTGGDYGVTAEVLNSSADEGIVAAEVTLWGVPAAESHDADERFCPGEKHGIDGECTERGPLIPFLSNPTACTGEREAHMTVEPWQEDDPPVVVGASAKMPAITGCGKLDFKPSMAIAPTSKASDSPTGLHVELKVPQNESPTGLAEADLKDAKVVLPAGVTVNPSSANGMAGCPLLTGKEGHPGVSGIDLENSEPANCPNAAKVGSVTIETPLLEKPLTGGVYVAQQDANPFKSLLALYIAAENAERGVVVKLAGHVELDPITGQLTTTFDENPQLPFENLKLDFFGGERASLATPRSCGSYQPTALLEPFSHQGAPGEEGTPDAEPFIAPFSITSGPGGARCSNVGVFAPGFVAGTQNNAAAAFSPFVLNLTRGDGEQTLSTVNLQMPPGVSGTVSSVTLCPEPQASLGDCPAASKIGHVRASAGVGKEPIVLPEAGKPEDPVYLTSSYEGAPFGLSVVVPAEAGPFNLDEGGHPIVVRAKVEVNPYTGQVTVLSDPMPTRLQGIPLDVRDIEVVVDKPGFIFNPTNCNPMNVTGTIGSAEGASTSVSSRFQAADCASLPFKPTFTTATSAKHSRNGGDNLQVVVKSTPGQANIAMVHVELPRVLPSRLSTLNQACPEGVFAADPAACPAGSRIGTAIAHTPILSVPLAGPAYFVSHGGAKFPELIVILQGEGVTVQLNGETFISKAGITSSTFKSIPDVPVSRFELDLPAGPDSVLGATGDLCANELAMPTTITGQNGAVVKQRTRIAVKGCKPEITVLRHSVKGDTATIVARVPSAGRFVASGNGVSRVVRSVNGAGQVTVKLALTKTDRLLLARHPEHHVRVDVKLHLTPTHGHPLASSVTVLVG